MAVTFKGGIHIPDCKTATNKIPIKKIDGSDIHIYPVVQHIGAPLEPKVSVGDKVCVGDVLADSDAYVSVPVHSSVSGIVKEIKPHLHSSGRMINAIFVENDRNYEISENVKPKDPEKMTKDEMIKVIRNAGIMGMGGAGFPTHVKLNVPADKEIEYIIVNGAECEPYLTSDHRRMLETPETVVDGLKICMKILGLDEGYIGIEANKKDAIKAIKNLKDEDIEVVTLKAKYPQGAEKQLIKAITGKKVPSGGLPADVGAVVINVDTATNISRAFRTGMPAITRIITMSGDCMSEPQNLETRTGMILSDLIEKAGGFSTEPKKVIMGGPMMGTALYSLDIPVIKTTSSILAVSKAHKVCDEDSACIRCGKCVKSCPMNLMPLYLNKYIAEGRLDMAEKYNALDCIECGVCAYVCPGRQSPVYNIRGAKQQILENRRKNDGK